MRRAKVADAPRVYRDDDRYSSEYESSRFGRYFVQAAFMGRAPAAPPRPKREARRNVVARFRQALRRPGEQLRMAQFLREFAQKTQPVHRPTERPANDYTQLAVGMFPASRNVQAAVLPHPREMKASRP